MRPSASVEVRSISTCTDCHSRRSANQITSAATSRPVNASASGRPLATRIMPTSTASEPARSEAKWTALAASAGDP